MYEALELFLLSSLLVFSFLYILRVIRVLCVGYGAEPECPTEEEPRNNVPAALPYQEETVSFNMELTERDPDTLPPTYEEVCGHDDKLPSYETALQAIDQTTEN